MYIGLRSFPDCITLADLSSIEATPIYRMAIAYEHFLEVVKFASSPNVVVAMVGAVNDFKDVIIERDQAVRNSRLMR